MFHPTLSSKKCLSFQTVGQFYGRIAYNFILNFIIVMHHEQIVQQGNINKKKPHTEIQKLT
jgi:hypothetical protein